MKIKTLLTCLFLLNSIAYFAAAQSNVQLPHRIDNSTNPYMRPVFNQSGSSCVAANWVGNMFNYEINLKRKLSSDSVQNQYPIYFSYNFGNHSYETAHENGIPLSQYYGHTISNDDNTVWPTGYNLYYNAMKNRVKSNEWFSISTPAGLKRLKHWLYNHEGDTSRRYGGVATFGISMGGIQYDTLSTNYEQGKKLIVGLGEGGNHIMTFAGYDDEIQYDWNKDGKITNDIDINGDGLVDMRDWEKGALIALNTWGTRYANNGRVYYPYALLKNVSVEIIHLYDEPYYTPKLTAKIKMKHEMRNTIGLRVGIAQDIEASKPEFERSYLIFDHGKSYHGKADVPILGSGNNDPIEIGLDISDLLGDVDPSRQVKLFFTCISDEVDKVDPKGEIISFSVISNESEGESTEYISADRNIDILEGQITRASVIIPGNMLFPPVNLAAIQGNVHTQLRWSAPLWENKALTGYQLFRNDEKIADLDKSQTEYEDKASTKAAITYYLKAVYEKDNHLICSEPSNSVSVVSENNDYCLQFDGETNYVSIPPLHLFSEATTIEMWIKTNCLLNEGTVFFENSKGASYVKMGTKHTTHHTVGEIEKKENRISYRWRNSHDGVVLPDDTWTHLAMVVYPDSLVLYMNDSILIKQQQNLMDNFNYESFIGGLPFSEDRMFKGCIDDIKIWSRALSHNEMQSATHKTIAEQMQDGLVACYFFNEPDGNQIIDATGRYHGTLYGTINNSRLAGQGLVKNRPIEHEPTISLVRSEKMTHLPQQFYNPHHNNSNNKYEWFFEGGRPQQAFSSSPMVIYNTPGEYTVQLKVTNSEGETETQEQKIKIEALPTPDLNFSTSLTQIHINDSIFFTDQSSYSPNSWHWTFEGGSPNVSNLKNPVVKYEKEGVYNVQLTVVNASGEKNITKQQMITVKGPLPVAGFTISEEEIIKGNKIIFTDTTLNNPNQWQWEFEGGTPAISSEQNPVIQYNQPGVYQVKLIAQNADGHASVVKEQCITVSNISAGNALFFNGENNVFVVDSIFNTPQEAYTVEFWLKPSSYKNWNQQFGGGWGRFLFHCNFDGSISAGLLGGGLTRINTEVNMIDIGVWQHFAYTFDQGEMRLYKNGTLIGSASAKVRFAPAWQYFVVGRNRPNGAVDGLVDELRIWKKARSEKEIQTTMNTELHKLKKYKDLECYFTFNSPIEDETIDQTGKHKARLLHYSEGQTKATQSAAFCR